MGISRKIKLFFRRIKKAKRLNKNYKIHKNRTPNFVTSVLSFNSSENPNVSIIIPFYNEAIYTHNCLKYLHQNLSQKYSFEIILIDDNSTEFCDFSFFSGIKIIKNEINLGFLKSINKGINSAKGEYVYILNNDTEVSPKFLEELFYVFENFENVGAVGSMLINSNNTLQEAGSVFMKDFNFRQIVKHKKLFNPEINYIHKVDYCSGCSLLFKKYSDIGNLNLFDEQFAPAYFEETDFCFQLRYLQNKFVYYTPFSKITHYNGVTYDSKKVKNQNKIEQKQKLFTVNKERFKNKWQIQLDAIKAPTVEDRIQEIYSQKSIVFFAGMVPEHDRDSGSNRFMEIIKAFIQQDYHVTLIVKNVYCENNYIEFYQRMGVNIFYEYKHFSSVITYLKNQKLNASLAWFYSPKPFINYYKIAKKYLPNAKLVYDMVDIHHLRYKRAIELDPKRISLKKNYHLYKKLEIKAAKVADYVITISDFEKNYMEQFCESRKLVTISNIHYPKIEKINTLPFKDRKDVLFIGSTHTPNIDALYYLYSKIMPLVWQKLPNLKVNVIGNIKDKINDISHPNIFFTGYVPKVEEYFISNKFMIAPLRYGAGVKGKIGQAFEYYLPLVTSSIGAEGMFLENKKNALINDTPEGFANNMIELYNDEVLWTSLQNNSEKSLEPFSIENLKQTILKLN